MAPGSSRLRAWVPSGRRIGELWSTGTVDPVLVWLVAFGIYVLRGYSAPLSRDLGTFVYGGEQFAHGIPPYVGVFNSVGPLADMMPGVAIWLGHFASLDPVLAARAFFTVLSAGCCALIYVLARDVWRSRVAGVVTAAVFVSFERFLTLATGGPREKTTMVLLLLAALIMVGRRRWLAAGAFTALATLTWQPVLAVALLTAAVAITLGGPGRARAAARFVVGGLIPSVAAVVYFAAYGALPVALNGFITVNVLYTSQPSPFTSPIDTWRFLWQGYHVSLIVFLVGLLGLVVLAITRLSRVVGRDKEPASTTDLAVVSLGAGAVAAMAWSLVAINGAPDLFVILPFGALGVTGLVLALSRHLSRTRVTVLVAAVASLATVLAVVESVGTIGPVTLPLQRADITAVMSAAPPGSTVLAMNASEVMAISRRTNPTHFLIYDPAIESYIRHSWRGGMAHYKAHVARIRPTFVVTSVTGSRRWPDKILARYYWKVGYGPTWVWYVSRTVGHQAFLRLRAANRHVMFG